MNIEDTPDEELTPEFRRIYSRDEDDEPVEQVKERFERGTKGVTSPPDDTLTPEAWRAAFPALEPLHGDGEPCYRSDCQTPHQLAPATTAPFAHGGPVTGPVVASEHPPGWLTRCLAGWRPGRHR